MEVTAGRTKIRGRQRFINPVSEKRTPRFYTCPKNDYAAGNLGYPAARSRGAPEGAMSRISSSGSAWNFVVPFISSPSNPRNNVKELETVYFCKVLRFSQLVGFLRGQILEFLRPTTWPIHHHSLHPVPPSQSERHRQLRLR